MAITDNGTAIDINTLLLWLFPSIPNQGEPIGRNAAMAAAERLARGAHKQLVAGVHHGHVFDAKLIDGWRFGEIDGGRQ